MKILIIAIIMTSGIFANISRTDSTDSIELTPRYSLGNVIGGIGLFNPKFIAQNIWGKYEFQLMAGLGGEGKYAIETDLNYLLSSSDNFSHSIGIGAGTLNYYKDNDKSFFGVSRNVVPSGLHTIVSVYGKLNYSLNWHILFLQTGIALGNNNYSAPKLKMQIGLLYHFK